PEAHNAVETLLSALERFTGTGREQEDDITIVSLTRLEGGDTGHEGRAPRVLAQFEFPSEPGNEQLAMEQIADAVAPLGLSDETVERLRTAVSEAVMNAIEHGNQGRSALPVAVSALVIGDELRIRVIDRGDVVVPDAPKPDLDLKLAGLQLPRGWGLFLIRNMVDDVRQHSDGESHTLELVLTLDTRGD